MPARPAVIASRRCLCEPGGGGGGGGEVNFMPVTVTEQYFHIPCSLVC